MSIELDKPFHLLNSARQRKKKGIRPNKCRGHLNSVKRGEGDALIRNLQ